MRGFASDLSEKMRVFSNELEETNKELELQDHEKDVIQFVSKIEKIKMKKAQQSDDMTYMDDSQQLLTEQKFDFPENWIDFSSIKASYDSFNESLSTKV